jgi:hypothetical protein
MTHWQKSGTRQAPKSKAELREMLTEAVRNTQPVLESFKRPAVGADKPRTVKSRS